MKKQRIINDSEKFEINTYVFECIIWYIAVKIVMGWFGLTQHQESQYQDIINVLGFISVLIIFGFDILCDGKDKFLNFTYYKKR